MMWGRGSPGPSRSPHGERGLKFGFQGSLNDEEGRSPHGERGLKFIQDYLKRGWRCRSPHGERGLKFRKQLLIKQNMQSLSSRRAWIEIWTWNYYNEEQYVALLTESVD